MLLPHVDLWREVKVRKGMSLDAGAESQVSTAPPQLPSLGSFIFLVLITSKPRAIHFSLVVSVNLVDGLFLHQSIASCLPIAMA